MIQQMWPPSQRLVPATALRCWVRQLPRDPDLKPASKSHCAPNRYG
jgi:hypothetical protein